MCTLVCCNNFQSGRKIFAIYEKKINFRADRGKRGVPIVDVIDATRE